MKKHLQLTSDNFNRRQILESGLASAMLLAGCGGGGGGPINAAPQLDPVVPVLDTWAAEWVPTAEIVSFPSVNNFWGALRAPLNLGAFEALSFAPYASLGTSGVLSVNGQLANASESRWYPYQVLRRGTVDGLELNSVLRMPLEQRGLLCRITLRNTSTAARTLTVSMVFQGGVRRFVDEDWARWDSPHGTSGNLMEQRDSILLATDQSGAYPAAMAYAFTTVPDVLNMAAGQATVSWQLTLNAGETRALGYAVAIEPSAASAMTQASAWATGFDASLAQAQERFELRWQKMFTPGNGVFSGHLPTLSTPDEKLRSVYYHGALAMFALARTNLPLAPMVFATLSPQFGLTLSYFWDSEMSSNAWAMLEPASQKISLLRWLALDLHGSAYAMDNLSLRPAGVWYAANDWAVFRTVDAYMSVTGDTALLQQTVAGQSVLDRLVSIATAYRSLVAPGQTLASYGENQNLLEDVPTYIHKVASLNGGNVYLLRRASQMLESAGQTQQAALLRTEADVLRDAVLQLYVSGQGVWAAEHNDGTRFALRHCFDFILTGQALDHDLSVPIKSEMTSFVSRELMSGGWFRAMSLQDPAASTSVRPDHGSTGAFDGWPALSMEVMCRFGAFSTALDFLHRIEPVLREGPFAQSHEFVQPGNRVRIASPASQDYNEICGAAFMQTIIKGFFGFDPVSAAASFPALVAANTPRGFSGTLQNVSYAGKQVTLVSDTQGVRAVMQ